VWVFVLVQFLATAGPSDRLGAPRVYGACGRMLVVEHAGRMLLSYVNASFTDRAELALQLISLVRRLWVRLTQAARRHSADILCGRLDDATLTADILN